MALPLGWSMSAATRDALTDALAVYRSCPAPTVTALCTGSTFNSLLDWWATVPTGG
jgi:hypothetical protein